MSIIVRSNEKIVSEPEATKTAETETSVDAKTAPEAKASDQKETEVSETLEPEDKEASESEEKESETDVETTDELKDESKDGLTEKPKKKSGFQRRVDKLTQRITAREQELEYWKQQALTASGSKTDSKVETKPADSTEGKPSPDTFESHAAYVEALTDWKVDQREKARDAKEQKTRIETEQSNIHSSHQKRVEAFRSSHDDFDEKLENLSDVPRSPAVEQVIINSDNGPALLYELAKNPAEAMRIAKLHPIAAALAMGKIEARIETKSSDETKTESKKVTKAPDPLKPLSAGGKGSAPKSIFDPTLSQAEYERLRTEQLKKRRQA